MMVVITYDVETVNAEGRRRLRRVAKQCVNFGQRVQNSVFECNVDAAQLAVLKHSLIEIIDKEKDSLRFYFLGNNWKSRCEHVGVKESYDPDGIMLV